MGVSYVAAAAAAVAAVFDTEGFRIHVSNWDPGLVVSMLKIPGSIFRWCGEMIMSFSGGRLVVCAWVSQLETRLTSFIPDVAERVSERRSVKLAILLVQLDFITSMR